MSGRHTIRSRVLLCGLPMSTLLYHPAAIYGSGVSMESCKQYFFSFQKLYFLCVETVNVKGGIFKMVLKIPKKISKK